MKSRTPAGNHRRQRASSVAGASSIAMKRRSAAALSGVASVVGFLLILQFASGLTQGRLAPLVPGIL